MPMKWKILCNCEESDDVIGGSTKAVRHSIKNICRNIRAVFFKVGARSVHPKRNRITPVMISGGSKPWAKGGGGGGLDFLALVALFPSVICSFLPKIRGGGAAPPLDLPLMITVDQNSQIIKPFSSQRPHSFRSAPRIETSGKVQFSEHVQSNHFISSANHIDANHTQGDWKSVNCGPLVLDLPRGRSSWCWPKGECSLWGREWT